MFLLFTETLVNIRLQQNKLDQSVIYISQILIAAILSTTFRQKQLET